jgi:uncharacterized protein (TIGR02452 family)
MNHGYNKKQNNNYSKSKEYRKQIYYDNLKLEKKMDIPKTIQVDYFKISKDELNKVYDLESNSTKIIFKELKTDDCVIWLIEHGLSVNVVIHSFSSNSNCGGGYKNGASAQEEDLCRTILGLHTSMKKLADKNKGKYGKLYFPKTSVLITPYLKIMRENKYYGLVEEHEYIPVSVISAGAPNAGHLAKYGKKVNIDEIIDTLENIYLSTKKYLPNTDTLVLGAWGCGVYKNDPNLISQIIENLNFKYGGLYKNIVISIPKGRKGDNPTIDIFKNNITANF